MTIHLGLLVVAIILFFIGATLAFRWFGTTSADDALGWVALGLIALTASTAAGDRNL